MSIFPGNVSPCSRTAEPMHPKSPKSLPAGILSRTRNQGLPLILKKQLVHTTGRFPKTSSCATKRQMMEVESPRNNVVKQSDRSVGASAPTQLVSGRRSLVSTLPSPPTASGTTSALHHKGDASVSQRKEPAPAEGTEIGCLKRVRDVCLLASRTGWSLNGYHLPSDGGILPSFGRRDLLAAYLKETVPWRGQHLNGLETTEHSNPTMRDYGPSRSSKFQGQNSLPNCALGVQLEALWARMRGKLWK